MTNWAACVFYNKMKIVKLAAVLAIIAELILCLVFVQFGRISFHNSAHSNFIGEFGMWFHLPGLFLGGHLFSIPEREGIRWFHLAVVCLVGAVQFFLVIWTLIASCAKLRVKKQASGTADRLGS